MDRRRFILSSLLAPLPALPFQSEKSNLKITGVRLVRMRQRKAPPQYTPSPGSWSTGGVEVANPMSIYPEYKAQRSLFMANDPAMGGFTVEISTDKGVKGYGNGGPAGGTNYLLATTNLALAASLWSRAATNRFDLTGSYAITSSVPVGIAQRFYRLQLP